MQSDRQWVTRGEGGYGAQAGSAIAPPLAFGSHGLFAELTLPSACETIQGLAAPIVRMWRNWQTR